MFEANLEQNLLALMYDLKHRGHYLPQPLLRVYGSKMKGGLRRFIGLEGEIFGLESGGVLDLHHPLAAEQLFIEAYSPP